MERLLQIVDWLGIELSDLAVMVRVHLPTDLSVLSPTQEEFLAADDNMWAFYNMLVNGRSMNDITREVGLTRRSVDRYVRELTRVGLVRVTDHGTIRAKRPKTKLRPGGPLFGKHLSNVVRAFSELIVQQGLDPGRIASGANAEQIHLNASDYSMRGETFREYLAELSALQAKYSENYRVESKVGALRSAGRLYSLTLAFYDSEDAKANQEKLKHSLKEWTTIANTP